MEGGVGEHHAEVFVARGDEGGDGAVVTPAQQDDGTFVGGQERSLLVVHVAVLFHRLQVEGHNGEGLVHPPLSLPQPGHRLVVRRVAGQVEAAQALDGQDAPGVQEIPCCLDGRLEERFRFHVPGFRFNLRLET